MEWWEERATYALLGDAEATHECLEGVKVMLAEIRRLRRLARHLRARLKTEA